MYDTGEIWDVEGDDLAYEYTKVILKKGDAFYHARTFGRLGSTINVENPSPFRDHASLFNRLDQSAHSVAKQLLR